MLRICILRKDSAKSAESAMQKNYEFDFLHGIIGIIGIFQNLTID